jgi:hypothetical protein
MDVNPEELGSGVNDMQLTHQTRCGRLCNWFSSRSFYFETCIGEVTEGFLDRFQYSFFGRNRLSISASEMMAMQTSPIGVCLGGLWQLVQQWSSAKDGPWRILSLSGWSDFDSHDVRLSARAHALGLAAGVVHHYDMKFSEMPWLLHRLVSSEWSDEARGEVCDLLKDSRPCNLPLFAREFRHKYPTTEQMLSAAAKGTVRVWLAGKRFSTKASELGHATERKALAAANAPGRAFIPHSRRDMLHKHRLTHLSRGGADPLALVPLKRSSKASTPALVDGPDVFEHVMPKALLAKLPPLPANVGEALRAIVDAPARVCSAQDVV